MGTMAEVTVAGYEVAFVPGTGWRWQGWDGRLPIRPVSRGLTDAGREVAVSDDLLRLADGLIGRSYVADGFDATAGVVSGATIEIEWPSMSRLLRVAGRGVVLTTTHGRFRMTVVPSMNGTPAPDPIALKSGTFRILSGQRTALISSV